MQAKPRRLAKRTTAIIVIAIVAIVIVSGGGTYYYINYVAPRPISCTLPSGRDAIKVGFTISLTGTYNVEGSKSLAGIEAAACWINSNGGVTVNGKTYNIVLDYHDDASSSSNISPLYTSIITQDHAQFLLAPYSSGLTGTAAPLAEQNNLVMLSHGGSSDSIWTKGYKNVFGVLSPASTYFNNAINWLKANHLGDKLAFLHSDDSFSTTASVAASRYAVQQGLTVVYNYSYPSMGTQDLSTQLTAAQVAGADDLLGGGHYADGLKIVQQLSSVGWTPKFISLLVAVTEPQFQQQLGGAANLVTGPSQWETTVTYSPASAQTAGIPWYGPTESQFVDYYSKQANAGSPTYHSGEAGAAILVLVNAIHNANSLDTTAVRQAISGMHIMTFFGQFQVDATGKQSAHSMVLVQWQNGELAVVAPAIVTSGTVKYPYTGS
ncbi:branched-chain amino acid ABC transporter substrate-binding protein [Candidatus Bathyarchaeota archaeon]|nr:MAG: branched-chain amino acid ABC transporter substrate-binding protein [Candidatus Bathyarchaeota archaeon]